MRRATTCGRESPPFLATGPPCAKRLRAPNPQIHKQLGRRAQGFDKLVRERERETAFITGTYKFAQNPTMQQRLLGTGDIILAEASSFGSSWGIGLRADDPAARSPSTMVGFEPFGLSKPWKRSGVSFVTTHRCLSPRLECRRRYGPGRDCRSQRSYHPACAGGLKSFRRFAHRLSRCGPQCAE